MTVSLIGALLLAGCATAQDRTLRLPTEVRYVRRAEWGARPPVLPMRSHTVTRLTIHHTATPQNFRRTIEEKLRGLQQFSQRADSLASGARKPVWPDVPYHFYVAVDGSVGEARDWRFAGDTNTSYDPTGHLLVVVEGNFEVDTLTTAQRRTLDRLIPALARSIKVPAERLAAHRDFADTLCPGAKLYALLPYFRELVER